MSDFEVATASVCAVVNDPHGAARRIIELESKLASVEAERDEWKRFADSGLESYARDQAEISKLASQLEHCQRTISFFASVIQSGEQWSEQCEEHLREALK